ncbi:hypothetical protein GCM10023339_04750 [Alloalcanivorax gelatiniphagus]
MTTQNDPSEDSEAPSESAELVAKWGDRELGVRATSRTTSGLVRTTKLLVAAAMALAGLAAFVILVLADRPEAAYVALGFGVAAALTLLLLAIRG